MTSVNEEKMTKKRSFVLIGVIICVLQLPMIWNHSVNLGGDTLFHYNRIYDSAMQLRYGNFQPLYSFYGFNGTLRVINALYGPVLSYIFGGIALISGSWFKFDLIVNVLLGISMSAALWRLFNLQKIPNTWRVLLIGLTLSSNNYVSWLLQHQFNAIGAIPLILIVTILIRMYQNPKNPIKLIELSCSMALLIQIHMLSTLFAILVLIPLTLMATYWWQEKLKTWFKILEAVMLSILLTANVWWPYLYVTRNNIIETPGTSSMSGNVTHFFENNYAWNGTVNWPVSIIIFTILIVGLIFWKQINRVTRVLTVFGWTLLVLQTNLVPWDLLLHFWPAIAVIQFPFRFGFLSIILIVALVGQYIVSYEKMDVTQLGITIFTVIIFIGLFITYNNIWQWNANFHSDIVTNIVKKPSNGQIGSTTNAKKAFFSSDLQTGILKSSRGSTDYLTGSNKDYFKYNETVFLTSNKYTKKVSGSEEILTWQSNKGNLMTVPIAVYKGLTLELNGQRINVKRDNLGLAIINSKKGHNKLVVRQVTPSSIYFSYYMSAAVWSIVAVSQFYTGQRKSKAIN